VKAQADGYNSPKP